MLDLFNIDFTWILSGITSGSTGLTWIQIPYEEPFENVTDIRENYFNYQKCWSGVCYNYVRELNDIYGKSEITGNPDYVRNYYNEFVVIDSCMKNFASVDLVVDYDIDFTKRYTKFDNILLKSNYRILVKDQTDLTKNGIYKISSSGYLIPDDDLSDTGKTYMYSIFVRNGSYKDNQFFLMNSGDTSYFPTTYEEKEFIGGRSHIIKNRFYYNLYQTGTTLDIAPKLLFTDYEIARKSFKNISTLYNGITLSDITEIRYYINSTNYVNYSISPIVSEIGLPISDVINWSGHTRVSTSAFSIGDYVTFRIKNGNDLILLYKTYIHLVNGSDTFLLSTIPSEILELIKTGYTSSTYDIVKDENASDLYKLINNKEIPFSESFHYYNGVLLPIKNEYIDYDAFRILHSAGAVGGDPFETSIFYAKYKLYEHLNLINSSKFTTTYNIKTEESSGENTIIPTWTGYTGYNIYIDDQLYNQIIISGSTSGFTEYTYVDLNGNSQYRTLITEVQDQFIKVEMPVQFYDLTNYGALSNAVNSIQTAYELQKVSNILYDVYKNYNSGVTAGYYRKQPDNIRRKICGAYGDILSENIDIQTGTTSIITQNIYGDFELRLFNVENPNLTTNTGSTTMDKNLFYKPADLLKVGWDKKTAFPLPIFDNNIQIIPD